MTGPVAALTAGTTLALLIIGVLADAAYTATLHSLGRGVDDWTPLDPWETDQ